MSSDVSVGVNDGQIKLIGVDNLPNSPAGSLGYPTHLGVTLKVKLFCAYAHKEEQR